MASEAVGTLRKHAAAIALIGSLIVQGGFGMWAAPPRGGVDFATYYIAARAMVQGQNIYTITIDTWHSLMAGYGIRDYGGDYVYPPLTAGIVSLFAGLPYRTSAAIWTVIIILGLAASGLCLSQVIGNRWVRADVFVALALYVPALTTIYAGQINSLLLLGVALYLLFIRSQRYLASGFALATSIVLKPITIPLIAHLIWRRDTTKILGLAIGFVGVAVLSTLRTGFQVNADYLANGLWYAGSFAGVKQGAPPPNQSIFGFFVRALTAHEYGPSLGDYPGVATALSLISVGALLLGVAFLTWPRKDIDGGHFALETGLVLVAGNLVFTTVWYHHTLLSIVPFLLAWNGAAASERRWLVAAFALIDVQGLFWHQLQGYTPFLSLGTYGMLIIYGIVARRLFQAKFHQARYQPRPA